MAAINKNFVIKNGLEVDTNLILADAYTNKVGIGTTVPQYTLHVNGGIGVTDLYVSGIATIITGNITNLTSTNLTGTAGTITTFNSTNLRSTNLNVTGIATIATLNATGIAVTNFTVYNNLSVGGISTFTNGPVLIGSGTSTGTASQPLQVTGGAYVSGNLGIGSTNPTSKLHVIGDARIAGIITATTFSGAVSGIAASATQLVTPRTFEITGDVVASPISFDGTGNVSLAATIQPNSVGLGTDTTGDYVRDITGTSNQISVSVTSGEGSTPTLSVPNQFTAPQDVTVTRDLLVSRNLNVTGNITIGGTSATIFSQTLNIFDPDIVLGVRTDVLGNDVSTDNTANHGGVAIASTEGTPLVDLFIAGIETNPSTYKKIMWFKSGTFAGLGTDAWLSNYAVGIGSTQFPLGTRLAAGNVQFTENDLAVVRNINASGVVTATTFIGNVNAGVGTITNGTITNLTGTAATIGTVKIVSGIVTATSGIVTYYGDGNFLNLTSNPSRGIGIGTTGGVVGYAVTFIDFKGAGVSTTQYNSSTGIATIFFEGGGGGGSISISTTAPLLPGSGDLWYSPDYGRTFIYYDESVVGYGTDAFWVDAAPFNVGIITSVTNVSFSPGSAVSPSMFFVGDNQTGFFSPGSGQFTVVSSGSSVLNVNVSGIRVTGVTTITNASGTVTIGIGTTALLVEGNARVTGILTVGSSSITLNGASNIINVGTGLTLSSSGINVTGVVTATSFVGNGSGLTGAGSTVFIDTTTNQEFFPLFTSTTSGTITASGISTSKLTYNPSTGTVTATDFDALSDENYKKNVITVNNALNKVEKLRGVSFDWKENGRSSYGVIAQELQKVLPELVHGDNPKTVNYNGLVGVLIEAIKELKKEVEELKLLNKIESRVINDDGH